MGVKRHGNNHSYSQANLDTDTSFPDGAVARIEASFAHMGFVWAAEPDWVSMKIAPHVRRLVDNGLTAESCVPDGTNVITTSTIHDRELSSLTVSEEADLVEAFEPDVHVAGDVSAYLWMLPSKRAELIRESMRNAIWLDRECDSDATFVPILKGPTVQERELCYTAMEYFDHDYIAVYATRYFTGGGGANTYKLVEDLFEIHNESNLDIFLIGAMSPRVTEKTPDSVVAAGGLNTWKSEISFSEFDPERASSVWDGLSEEIRQAVDYSPTIDDITRKGQSTLAD